MIAGSNEVNNPALPAGTLMSMYQKAKALGMGRVAHVSLGESHLVHNGISDHARDIFEPKWTHQAVRKEVENTEVLSISNTRAHTRTVKGGTMTA